jgi:hypothetical protein
MTTNLNPGMTRRTFLVDSAVLLAASQLAAGAQASMNSATDPKGGAPLGAPSAAVPRVPPMAQPFALTEVRLLDVPFKVSRDAEARYLMSLEVDRLLAPYRIEAGLKEKARQYPGWETDFLPGVALAFYLSAVSNLAVSINGWEATRFAAG